MVQVSPSKITVPSPVHCSNAEAPTDLTEAGMVILVIEALSLNAPAAIEVTGRPLYSAGMLISFLAVLIQLIT